MIKIQKPNFLYSSFTIRSIKDVEWKLARFGNITYGSKIKNARAKINDDNDVYFFHAEKHRKKVERKISKNGKRTSKIISRTHWKVRVFRFRHENIVSGVQYKHHFEVTLKMQ